MLVNYVSSEKNKTVVRRLYDLLKENIEQGGSVCWKDIKVTVPEVYSKDQEKCNELCRLVKEKDEAIAARRS